MECPKGIQIAIKGLIFAVPFKIKGYPIFHKINLVPIHKIINARFGNFLASILVSFDGNYQVTMNACFVPV